MSDWHQRAVCKVCGWHEQVPFGSLFHLNVTCCPKCGNPKPRLRDTSQDWTIKTMRHVALPAVWYNPLTWFQWKWETKE